MPVQPSKPCVDCVRLQERIARLEQDLIVAKRNAKAPGYKHGHTADGKISTEFRIWAQMIGRCHTKTNSEAYKNYGGRGIRVCKQWRDSFAVFLQDVGYRPSKNHSLDRINNDGNYEPGNVRWATRLEQANNSRHCHYVTIHGRKQSLAQWGREYNISNFTIGTRLNAGWSEVDAITVPTRRIKRLTEIQLAAVIANPPKCTETAALSKKLGITRSALNKILRDRGLGRYARGQKKGGRRAHTA